MSIEENNEEREEPLTRSSSILGNELQPPILQIEGIFVERLNPRTIIMKRGNSIFIKIDLLPEERELGEKYSTSCLDHAFHPNILRIARVIKHRDLSYEIEAEYCNGKTLEFYIPHFPITTRIAVAKSIMRQLLEGLNYMEIVFGRKHGNLHLSKVFIRQDGCVKIGSFGFSENENYKGDLWMVGAIVIAIMTGKSQSIGFINDLVKEGTPEVWKSLIPDDALRYLTIKCFKCEKHPILHALATCYLFGGCYKFNTQEEIDTHLRRIQEVRAHFEKAEKSHQFTINTLVQSHLSDTNDEKPIETAISEALRKIPIIEIEEIELGQKTPAMPEQAYATSGVGNTCNAENERNLPNVGNPSFVRRHAEEDVLISNPKDYPNPFMTPFKAFEKHTQYCDIRGKRLRIDLLMMPPLYKDENSINISIEGYVIEIFTSICLSLGAEMHSWKEALKVSETKSFVNLSMREIFKARQIFAWMTLSRCVEDAKKKIAEFLKSEIGSLKTRAKC